MVVFDVLIESKRKKAGKKAFSVGFISLTVHTAVIAGAVYATLNAGQTDHSVKVDTAMVFLDQQQQQKPPEQQPVQLDVPRSEERRVGKECRSRREPGHE